MHSVAAATIVAKNHLSSARVLADSFRRHHPDVPFYVLLADEVDDYFDVERESFQLLRLDDLAVPQLARLKFHYTRQELSYAVTPSLLVHLLKRGFTGVVFLKQESLVVGDMTPVLGLLERHPILLTPHLLKPLAGEGGAARELEIMLAGVYNGGFLGFANTPETQQFLEWWENRLCTHCRHAVAKGMHFEQRWLDFAPAYVKNVHIVRDPGMNVAHWNLPERRVRVAGNSVLADGVPCRLFRFSGFDPDTPEAVTRYSSRLTLENVGPSEELYRRYHKLLKDAGYEQTQRWPYAYEQFDNGVPIPDFVRTIYRGLDDVNRFGDPFLTAPPGSYFRWLVSPPGERPSPCPPVSRFWRIIYDQRPDLQALFHLHETEGREAFLRWTERYGAAEYAINRDYLVYVTATP